MVTPETYLPVSALPFDDDEMGMEGVDIGGSGWQSRIGEILLGDEVVTYRSYGVGTGEGSAYGELHTGLDTAGGCGSGQHSLVADFLDVFVGNRLGNQSGHMGIEAFNLFTLDFCHGLKY